MRKVLVTGSAGFVGFHIALRCLQRGDAVRGVDNFNSYYSVSLKEKRSKILREFPDFSEVRASINADDILADLLKKDKFDSIFHMAAQAGVRYSLEAPYLYTQSNIDGSLKLFEALRMHQPSSNCIAASSSSVYGRSEQMPFRESDAADQPSSLYAATKRSMELIASSYVHLYGLRIACLRFFTVYGPWGRPDMALFKFVQAIQNRESLELFNSGEMKRDFTFVDDVVSACFSVEAFQSSAKLSPANDNGLFEIFNVGCGNPVEVKEFVRAIESSLGLKALIQNQPFQPGDVHATHADITKIQGMTGWRPKVSINEGIQHFVDWYRAHY